MIKPSGYSHRAFLLQNPRIKTDARPSLDLCTHTHRHINSRSIPTALRSTHRAGIKELAVASDDVALVEPARDPVLGRQVGVQQLAQGGGGGGGVSAGGAAQLLHKLQAAGRRWEEKKKKVLYSNLHIILYIYYSRADNKTLGLAGQT